MSLVGTRPILPDELEQYELHHRARIAIKPGITGMWQVSGRSDITDFEEIVRLDTEYISEWNIGLDIKILFNRTAVIRIAAKESETDRDRILSASFHGKTKKWDAEVTGEDGWENSFADMSSIFIPAKEILSHSYNLNAATEKNNVRFDDTYLDIINAAKINISAGRNSASKEAMLKIIEKMTQGTVVYDEKKDEFYLKSGNSKQEFNLVAEGIRKMALLWQLVKNGTLEKGSVLFWDEPEANVNPLYISIIVDLLLELQRKDVQIFISTHDYMLASYFEVKKTAEDHLLYHSLSHSGKKAVLEYEKSERFSELKNNKIIEAFNKLLDEIYNMEV